MSMKIKGLAAAFSAAFLAAWAIGYPAFAQNAQFPGAGGGVTLSGTPVVGDCAKFSSTTAITDAGAACGSGGSGVPANLTLTNPASAATLTLVGGKTFTVNNTLALAGTDGTTITLPSTTSTVATTGANTYTGTQTTSGAFASTSTSAAFQSNFATLFSGTKPSVGTGAGAGTTPAVTGSETGAWSFVVGSSPTSGSFTVTFSGANQHFWNCHLDDQTTPANVIAQVAGGSTTTAVFQAFSRTTGSAQAMTAADVVSGECVGG